MSGVNYKQLCVPKKAEEFLDRISNLIVAYHPIMNWPLTLEIILF